MIARVLFFCVMVALSTFLPVWLFAIAVCAYAFRYTAYELILLGMFIDTFYGLDMPFVIPYYTLTIIVGLIFIEWIKPQLLLYNESNAV